MKVFTVGRFQPYNLKHKEMVERMKEFGDISIGLLTTLPTYDNPFTYEERKEMMSEDIDKIFPVTLTPNLFRMRKQLLSEAGCSTYYTRDRDSKTLFEIFGFPVIYERRDGYSSSEVRSKLFSGDPSWKNMVDSKTADIIERPEVQERLTRLKKGRLPFSKVRKYVSLL